MINENQEMWKIVFVNGEELGCTSLSQEVGNTIMFPNYPEHEFEIVGFNKESKEFYVE